MARVNVYLSDELAAKVKAAKIEISAVCQTALAEAVELRSRNVSNALDLVAAARRLRAITPKFQYEEGKPVGRTWVTQVAIFEELEYLDRITSISIDDFASLLYYTRDYAPTPIGQPMSRPDAEGSAKAEEVEVEEEDEFDPTEVFAIENTDNLTLVDFLHAQKRPINNDSYIRIDEWLRGFIDGAKEAWAEVRELLTLDDSTLQRRESLLADYEKETVTQAATTDVQNAQD